jgi:hypothetical protein
MPIYKGIDGNLYKSDYVICANGVPVPPSKNIVFCNIQEPDLYKMASCAGRKLTDGGYMPDRKHAVKLDGVKMAASEARALILNEFEFVTFNNAPCKV